MAEILADIADINTHLPPNILANDALTDIQVDAQRLIRGQLGTAFDITIINTWVSPATTPGEIRGIAGRLISAKYYARLLSQESTDEFPGYPTMIYKEAISMLTDLKLGNTVLIGVDGNIISLINGGDLTTADVFPNDSSTDGPYFTMSRTTGTH